MKFVSSSRGLALLLLAGSAWAQSDIPALEDYAYHFPLIIDQPAEYLEAELPLEVYRSVSDPALRDIGVYNAAGQAVPRIIEHPRPQESSVDVATPLGMVPLYNQPEEAERRLKMLLQLHDAGTTLQFDSDLAEPNDPALELQAIIVDLRGHETPIQALEFNWSGNDTGFIGGVTIVDSDDLSEWRNLASGTIAELEFQGTRIERRRIHIGRQPRDFLRVTWHEMPTGWHITSLSGVARETGTDETRQWITLDPVERGEDGRSFVFEIGGYPPVDRVDLELPGQNVVVRASVDLHHEAGYGWQRAYEGIFYDVDREGLEFRSEVARLGRTSASKWRVQIHSGQVDGNLKLRLGWRPDRLSFLSQGSAPYTLATGRGQDSVEQYPQQRLLGDKGIFTVLKRNGEPGQASVGARSEGAGAMVMEGARTWTWRTVMVWLGLIAAVVFVGWLAFSLLREQ